MAPIPARSTAWAGLRSYRLHRQPQNAQAVPFKPEVQKQLLAAIAQIAKGEAAAAGAPREPTIFVNPGESAQSLHNDPALTERLADSLRRALGTANVVTTEPTRGSEDFGVFGRASGAPSVMLRIGAAEPGAFARAKAAGTFVPGPHSAAFAPDREPTIRAGVAAYALSVFELLGRPRESL